MRQEGRVRGEVRPESAERDGFSQRGRWPVIRRRSIPPILMTRSVPYGELLSAPVSPRVAQLNIVSGLDPREPSRIVTTHGEKNCDLVCSVRGLGMRL